ncbi:MAG: hypothetical protein ACRDFZ_06285 [Candidatus Limnocylindria bacterium]
MTTSGWQGPVRLRASVPGKVPLDVAARLIGPEVTAWLGRVTADSPSGMRRFAADLRLRPDAGGVLAAFHKAAYVDLGSSRPVSDGLRVEISWRSATLAPLFPVFSGWLTVGPSDLRLDGYYAPPGGAIGVVADRALLHLAARGTARWLLGQLLRQAAVRDPSGSPRGSRHVGLNSSMSKKENS